MKIGRNDPCRCGSGKKYKRCHLALDMQTVSSVQQPSARAAPPSPPPDLGQMTGLLREFTRKGTKEERADFERLLAQTKPIMAYLERSAEIEAASAALEAHRAEFCRLADDEKAYLDRTQALFAEQRFAPLWFTAADVRRAFDRVGYPPNLSPDDRVVENLRAAILYLADKDRRSQLAMDLLLHLPHYAAAGRHLDGWLIQYCAHTTIESTEESNLFLFQMFSHGYDAWLDEQRSRDEALLRELGMDPERLRRMSLDEIDAWLEAQQADPAQQARMEALMKANPDRRAQAGADRLARWPNPPSQPSASSNWWLSSRHTGASDSRLATKTRLVAPWGPLSPWNVRPTPPGTIFSMPCVLSHCARSLMTWRSRARMTSAKVSAALQYQIPRNVMLYRPSFMPPFIACPPPGCEAGLAPATMLRAVAPAITWWNTQNAWRNQALPPDPLVRFDGEWSRRLISS